MAREYLTPTPGTPHTIITTFSRPMRRMGIMVVLRNINEHVFCHFISHYCFLIFDYLFCPFHLESILCTLQGL